MLRIAVVLPVIALAACAGAPKPDTGTAPASAPPPRAQPVPDGAREAELEREVSRLRIQLLERSSQLADSERRLADATTEVVRAMARLRTLATRAEAASAIAEAEVTLRQLRDRSGQAAAPEAAQADAHLRAASAAFDEANFGGAVYLATQAKRVATLGRGRLAEAGGGAPRPGERAFALPVPLLTISRANLRVAPSASAAVITAAPAGTSLTAYAHEQDWLRVTTADGRSVWVHQSLVRADPARP